MTHNGLPVLALYLLDRLCVGENARSALWHHLAARMNPKHLKDRLANVETDCRNRLQSLPMHLTACRQCLAKERWRRVGPVLG